MPLALIAAAGLEPTARAEDIPVDGFVAWPGPRHIFALGHDEGRHARKT